MVNKDMFYFADIDERFINETKNLEGLEDGVLVHCQQCIEKNIKGIILKKYGIASKEHNLVKLLETLYLSDYTELKKYKNLCRDLKDFYFSRRYASDDYEFLSDDEYKEYIDNFYDLLNELKVIRNSI
ncbi:HEPN domain-containing protein [Clostridium botulinum]|uniref:HEPN domain-containing protein n=1 Tax=Clostridium botulinum TaxID=1491 RepID=A0A6B4JJU1_CLOBO|nr:HEPN domain-containing protein [Clostridium botulinum]EES50284.1 hepn domain, putative [Clostridium botulinum E1 str. 'BoNT E Beluga']MBY6760365.1 HEPN domain-containing protein [Clostridium botulinum]MBY6919272.1 HEPN domain-containing protein [Clostridium botulinum]MCR1130150.1 HEPN domain-containing protein [Clostridium botulinum]NFH69187.1 HEPN domain-containing protein [Clostridium botulinum]